MNRKKSVKSSSITCGIAKAGSLNPSLLVVTIAAAAALQSSNAQVSGWNKTGVGVYDYSDSSNWVGGNVNGLWDASLTLTGHQSATFSSNTTLVTPLNFEYAGGFNVTLTGTTGAQTLTLGGDITVNTVSNSRTINFGSLTANQNLNVDLGGQTRTFNVGSGRSLGFVNVISNGALDIYGGTVNFSGSNTYAGATRVYSGNLSLNGAAGSAANSDIFVKAMNNATTSVTFNSNAGTGAVRAKSVTLDGVGGSSTATATLSVAGHAGADTVDSISGSLTVAQGFGIVSVGANAAQSAQLAANSFVRGDNTTTFFRGSNLGLNTIASQANGAANIVFASSPTLVGGGGTAGTTTVSILQGAFGGTTAAQTTGDGLVTYDSTYGVRLLTSSEYTATIADGQSQLDNVRFSRASGSASQNVNLTAATTINSLSFNITGAGTNSGVTVSGDAGTSLTLASGAIFAKQSVTTANATDAMIVSVPTLNLGGNEGTIITFTNGVSNGNTAAPLDISSAITNDGGKGVTIGGTGQVIFSGSVASTYTGPTVLNSGILRLNKSVANIGLTTDLIMNGGTLLKTSNAIADTASVTVNNGSFVMDSTTSSGNNGHQETVNNFTMNGGNFSNHGSNASFTANGNLTLNASQFGMNQGGDITVSNNTVLNGGQLLARESSSTTVSNALTSLNSLNIVNQAIGSYTAMILNSHATNKGALVTLNGDLTFTGNGTNTNTVLIDSSNSALANQGVIALNGARTFNVGNGAAAVDLTILPALVNSTSGDGLTKTGVGTLLLGGANTYTGATTVSAGTLLINGSSVSAVTVNGGAFGGAGTITNTVSIGNSGTLAPGNSPGTLNTGSLSLTGTAATIAMEISGTGAGQYDQVDVTGGVTLDGNGKIEVTMLSYVPQPTDVYFLILNDGLDAITGTLYGIAQGGTFTSGGYTWQVSYNGDSATNSFSAVDGNDLALQIIPEPAAWMLVTGGLMAVTFLRRRRAS